MKPGSGKAKGSGFERTICEKFSLWLSHGERKDLMCRTVGSGGQFTSARNRGTQAGLAGDIRSQDPMADKFCNLFVLECKFWSDLQIIRFLSKQGELYDAMIKVKNEGILVKKSWILVSKQNHKPEILFMPFDEMISYSLKIKPDVDFHLLFNGTVYMCVLDKFLSAVNPETFTERI